MNHTSSASNDAVEPGVTLEIKNPEKSSESDIKTHILVGFLTLVSQAILAGYGVVSVLYTKNLTINVYMFTFFRGLLSIPVTLSMAAIFEKGLMFPKPPYTREMCYFIILGFMANYLVSVLYLHSIILTSASYCAIFAQLIPIFTCIFLYAFKIEPLSSIPTVKGIVQVLGIITGFSFALSIVILQFRGFQESQTYTKLAIGTLLIIVNNVIFSLQYIVQTKLFYRNPNSVLKTRPLTTQAYSVSFGFILYFIFFIPYSIVNFQEFSRLSIKILIPLFYIGFLLCPVSYGLMAYCSKRLSPIMVGASFSLNVVLALIMLRIFTTEKLQAIQMILFIGVIAGVCMVLFAPFAEKYLKKPTANLENEDQTRT